MAGAVGDLYGFDYLNNGVDSFYTSSATESQSAQNGGYTLIGTNSLYLFQGTDGTCGQTVAMVYRFYAPSSGDHFYKFGSSTPGGYNYEGPVGLAFTSSNSYSSTIYRHYNPTTGDHHYTTAYNYGGGYSREGVAWYGPTVVTGCGNSSASNYNCYVNQDDSGCVYPVYGCTDSSADNYDSSADTDDGSCTYSGCTDSTADNYDSNADNDDGSCTYTPEFEWGFRLASNAPNGAFSNNITVDEGVTFQVKLDWHKANAIKNTGYRVGFEFDENDSISTASLTDFNGSTGTEYSINSNSGYVTYNITANEDISINEGTETMRVDFYTKTSANSSKTYRASRSITVNDTSYEILGCTDSTAFNYDPNANTDDGSCVPVVLGCIDSSLINYDPDANTDDGSCYYRPVVTGLNHSPSDSLVYTVAGTQSKDFGLTGQIRGLKENYHLQNSTNLKGSLRLVKFEYDSSNDSWNQIDINTNPTITYAGDDSGDNRFAFYNIEPNTFTVNRGTDEPYEYRIFTSANEPDSNIELIFDFPSSSRMRAYELPYDAQTTQILKGSTTTINVDAWNHTEPNESMIWELVYETSFNTRGTGPKASSDMFVASSGNFTITEDSSYDGIMPWDINDVKGTASVDIEVNDFIGEAISGNIYSFKIKRLANSELVAERFFQVNDAPLELTTWQADRGVIRFKPSYISYSSEYETTLSWQYNESPSTATGGVGGQKILFSSDDGSSGEINPGFAARTQVFPISAVPTPNPGKEYTFLLRYVNGDAFAQQQDSSDIVLTVEDPVQVQSMDFTQATIDDAVAYNTETKRLKPSFTQEIYVTASVLFAMTVTIQTNGGDTVTFGTDGANDLNNPDPFAINVYPVDTSNLVSGLNYVTVTAQGHSGETVTETLEIERYDPITFMLFPDTSLAPYEIGLGNSVPLAWITTGDLQDIVVAPTNADISSGATATSYNIIPDQSQNYIITARGLGGDSIVKTVNVKVLQPCKVDYFVSSQDPVQNGDDVTLYYQISGDYTSITLNGEPVTGGVTNSITVGPGSVYGYNQNSSNTYTLEVENGFATDSVTINFDIKDVDFGTPIGGTDFFGNPVTNGGEDITRRNVYLPANPLPQENGEDGYSIGISPNYKNISLYMAGGAGGNGGSNTNTYLTYGGLGGHADVLRFELASGSNYIFQVIPGFKGGTNTSPQTAGYFNTGGIGGDNGGSSGAIIDDYLGVGGGGGGATTLKQLLLDGYFAIAGGGGGGGGGTPYGWVGGDGTLSGSLQGVSGSSPNLLETQNKDGVDGTSTGGSTGGQGGGANDMTNLNLPRNPGLIAGSFISSLPADGGTQGLSLFDADIFTQNTSLPSYIGDKTTGNGFVVFEYTVGSPKINFFTISPQVQTGSNFFDINWDTEGMLNVTITQQREDEFGVPNPKLVSELKTGSITNYFSGLYSTAATPATDKFKLTATGSNGETYEQELTVSVQNAGGISLDGLNLTITGLEPNIPEVVYLGQANSALPTRLMGGVDDPVFFGKTESGPFSAIQTFNPGDNIYMQFPTAPFNKSVVDENGDPLTGTFGNPNPQTFTIYVNGRWIPDELVGSTLFAYDTEVYNDPGTGELGGFTPFVSGDGVLLMGSYGTDTTFTERTATWYRNTNNTSAVIITHIAGTNENGGNRPTGGSAATPEEGEVLELIIDPQDGSTPRTVNLIPNYNSVITYTTKENCYFIGGNTPTYYPCANTNGGNALSAIVFVDDPNTPGIDVTQCFYDCQIGTNNYNDVYGKWMNTTVELLANEKTPSTKLTLKSYANPTPLFGASIPQSIADNNKNAADVFGINSVGYVDNAGSIFATDYPGTNTFEVTVVTRPPVIKEIFDFDAPDTNDPFPDIDYNPDNSVEYIVSNQLEMDQIELQRSDESIEITSDDPNVQAYINNQWRNLRETD